jgi:peptidoglycan/LPS O-acetylase OafA/YrhL
MTSRRRSQRFSFAPLLAAGFWGVVLLLLVRPQPWPGVAAVVWPGAVALVMASAIVQLVSPWEPPPAAVSPRRRLDPKYA